MTEQKKVDRAGAGAAETSHIAADPAPARRRRQMAAHTILLASSCTWGVWPSCRFCFTFAAAPEAVVRSSTNGPLSACRTINGMNECTPLCVCTRAIPPASRIIIDHCHALIANYKCPRSVDFVTDPMPISGAGKILKSEMRKPCWEGCDVQVKRWNETFGLGDGG